MSLVNAYLTVFMNDLGVDRKVFTEDHDWKRHKSLFVLCYFTFCNVLHT